MIIAKHEHVELAAVQSDDGQHVCHATKLYAPLIGWLPAAQMGWSARTQSPLNSHEGLLNSSRPAYVAAAGMTALRAVSRLMTKSCACQAVNTKHS